MNPLRSVRLALDLLTAEGIAAVGRRVLDRLAENADRNSFVPRQDWPRDAAVPTLHVLATAPSPRLGGVQAQLVARRERERAAGRPFALFYPWAGRYRLELERGSERAALDLAPAPVGPSGAPPEPEPGSWVRAIRDAFARCGANRLRIEGVAGLPFTGLLELSAVLPLTLALHDFGLFCPRPHLVEEPGGGFCWWSRDRARCAACLQQTWPVAPDYQPLRRTLAARLLAGVDGAVFPSPFLQRAHLELFPTLDAARCRVEPPSLLARPVPEYRPQDPPRRIAFVGAAMRFKGAGLFAEVVANLGPRHPEIEWHAFGGGEPALLRSLSAMDVCVHGYYRAGTLPAQLARHRIDLALLLSIVPESYGLTLDECALAHVPFLTFNLGAQAERAGALGGRVMPLAEGAAAVASRIEAALASGTDYGNKK